ncbi:MAG TPA: DHH family phosphoesterase [Candidatus Saccharimonadales bacterium]|nr:DHH family phosphoesterase [Candidatus Saccharimonadales bacterium]
MKTLSKDLGLIKSTIDQANHIVIIQADNPDADSLGSALALEQILSGLNKQTSLYCGIDIPGYLSYIDGWDRVADEIPKKFDVSIIVDTSSGDLLGNLNKTEQVKWVSSRPCVVIDHHDVKSTIPYASVVYFQPAAATGEIIFELASILDWQLNLASKYAIFSAIMADSLGLTTVSTTPRTIRIIADLVEGGVNIADLESKRRDNMRKKPELVHYKGELLKRIEYFGEDRVATVTIPWEEIQEYSHDYNPSMLVLDDMRLTANTDVAIAFKIYKDKRVTAKIKCNYGSGIANKLAMVFGGGGHEYVSGFKVVDGRSFEVIKDKCVNEALRLLEDLKKDDSNVKAS